jgi:HTH-like domain
MRKAMVEKSGSGLSVRRQCELLGINRNRLESPKRGGLGAEELELARRIDEIHLRFPEFGARRMSQWLLREGEAGASRRRVSQVMKAMGLEAIYRRPRTSQPAPGAQIYPYLLRGREVALADEVWCADVTYIPMSRGFAYLVAIMDSEDACSAFLETLQHAGRHVLCGSAARGAGSNRKWTGDLQYRSGLPVHQSGLDRHSGGERGQSEHGRERALEGQRVYRAALASGQTRGRLPLGA